jgi:hypothetical protein
MSARRDTLARTWRTRPLRVADGRRIACRRHRHLLLLVLLAPWRVADAAPAEATLQVMNRELATFREALAGADPTDPGGAGTGALPGHPASRLGTPGAAGTVRPW